MPGQYTKPKILIVDDVMPNLFMLGQILKGVDAEVDQANSGDDAWELIRENQYALLMTDVRMPGMSGYDLAQKVHGDVRSSYLPIIFITAWEENDDDTYEGYDNGAVDYLFKPLNAKKLLSKVRVFLELDKKRIELEDSLNYVHEARLKLERKNQDLANFAHIASHDLKTPLVTISTFAEFLGKKYTGRLDDKADGYIKRISDGVASMRGLIDDLLEYTMAEGEGLKHDSVDLNVVMGDVLSRLESVIDEKRVTIECESLPTVVGDMTRLAQIFQNLIANAIKFVKGRDPRIYVSVIEDAGFWYFEIADNGVGIRARDVGRVFKARERVGNTEEFEGTGLGLSVVQRVVEDHKGQIWVESELGVGSKFKFTLPVARDVTLPEEVARAA